MGTKDGLVKLIEFQRRTAGLSQPAAVAEKVLAGVAK
jgi:hypothetical protein